MSPQSDDPQIIPITVVPSAGTSSSSDITADSDLLERYVLGVLRPDEVEQATAYFKDPVRARVVEQAVIWARQDKGVIPPNRAETFKELWRQICDSEMSLTPTPRSAEHVRVGLIREGVRHRGGKLGTQTLREGRSGLQSRTLRVGVWTGALLVAIIGLALFAHQSKDMSSSVAHIYATQAYQQGILNLDDGTRVTLAPQTRLRVLQFGTQRRMVTLESGEAYFDVTHASGAPFVVQSGATTAQVLGTAFLIRHTPGNAHVRVSVAGGKVRVTTSAHADSGVTLTNGQIADVTDSITHVTTVDEVSPGTEWAPGLVIFRDTPLSKVLQTISQWYGYQFRYADQTLGARNVTIAISTQSSAKALATIEQVLSVNFTVVGDTVTLVPHGALSNQNAPRIRTYDVWSPPREVGR